MPNAVRSRLSLVLLEDCIKKETEETGHKSMCRDVEDLMIGRMLAWAHVLQRERERERETKGQSN